MAREFLNIEVEALDATQGYLVRVKGRDDTNGVRELAEHYDTEAATRSRLATVWDWWADQVNAE